MNIRIAKKITELKSSLAFKARHESHVMPNGEKHALLVHYKLAEAFKVLQENGLVSEEVSADCRTVTARLRRGKRVMLWSWKVPDEQ